MPSLWFRNTWSWGRSGEEYEPKPQLARSNNSALLAEHHRLGQFRFVAEPVPEQSGPEFLFTENETNMMGLYGVANPSLYVKDAFHDYLIQGAERRG